MWSGAASRIDTPCCVTIGAASTPTTTAQRAATAGPWLFAAARATLKATTIR